MGEKQLLAFLVSFILNGSIFIAFMSYFGYYKELNPFYRGLFAGFFALAIVIVLASLVGRPEGEPHGEFTMIAFGCAGASLLAILSTIVIKKRKSRQD